MRRLREQAGLTVRGLAKRLHGSHSSVVEYENGVRLAPVQVVQQYEELFALKPGELTARRERARKLRRQLDQPPEPPTRDVVCPYKGLEAFQSDDAALFFGREHQVERVLDRLATTRFLAAIGPSGSGSRAFRPLNSMRPVMGFHPGFTVVTSEGRCPR